MARFLIGLLIVLVLFCLIWTFLGEEVFGWALIIGGPGSAAVLLFLPKHGPQHAYRNWARMQLLVVLLVAVGLLAATIIALGYLLPPDVSDTVLYAGLMVPIVSLVAIILLWGQWMTPTASRSWLRKHYPAVGTAIRRYRQPGDVDEMYTPALVIDGKRQFLIFYHGKKGPAHVRGILLFEDQGRRVGDRALVGRAARCKSLALATIDYDKSQERARAIAVAEKAVAGMREVYEILRRAKDRFDELAPEVRRAWDRLMAAEEVVMAAIGMGRDIELLVAAWAATHGLGRLTEVVEGEAVELFERIEALRERDVQGYPVWVGACEAAGELAKAVRRLRGLSRRSLVLAGLLGLVDSAKVMTEDVVRREYWSLSDEHWAAWRERMAYADEVDAKEKVGEQG
ncbi:MAG: hypothetical protein AB1449_14455 [Chloroflexota bacterium]